MQLLTFTKVIYVSVSAKLKETGRMWRFHLWHKLQP